MEPAKPIITQGSSERNFLSFNLIFNTISYNFSFYDINNEKIRINTISNDSKYENELNFIKFKELNKCFKMFDSLKELEDDLIELNKSGKIEILNVSEKKIDICINVLTLDNNKLIIELYKVELNDKDKINKLIKENEEIKKELKLKDTKIISLEKEIQDLKNNFLNFKNNVEERLKNVKDSESPIGTNLLSFNSDIFLNQEENNLVLKQISSNIKSVKLLFSSKIDGNNINKLKDAYLNKPNLIFAVKTKKGRRFGGYSCETFLDTKFNKNDINAFLFSLDHMKVFNSKNTNWDIWNKDCDSIQFGGGTDLRIYYDFYSNKNYTSQFSVYYDYQNCPDYILNGEDKFYVVNLEIYQILF